MLETRERGALLVTVLLCAWSVGCRDGQDPSPAPPTRISTGPVGAETEVAGPALLPMATWTLPPDSAGVAPVTRDGPAPGPAPVASGLSGAPVGGIPEPTPLSEPAAAPGSSPEPDPAVAAMAGRVDAQRMLSDVRRLRAFGPPLPGAGGTAPAAAAAVDWLFGSLAALAPTAGAQVLVEREPFVATVAGRRAQQENVIATVTGIGLRKRFVYVVARQGGPSAEGDGAREAAGGADDNATGLAVLLEVARVLSERQWDATIRFVALASGDGGAPGAGHHAALARQVGLPIEAVINVDAVGAGEAAGAALVAVHAGGANDGPSQRLARHAAFVALNYGHPGLTLLSPGVDDALGSGDHLAFDAAGFAALRVMDHAAGQTPRGDRDDPDGGVTARSLAERARLTVALTANLALAPSPPPRAPVVAPAEGRTDALRVSWAAVDDPGVHGYWVAVRSVAEGHYNVFEWAGAATEHIVGGVPAGGRPRVAVAAADALGHVGLFGPEAGP